MKVFKIKFAVCKEIEFACYKTNFIRVMTIIKMVYEPKNIAFKN